MYVAAVLQPVPMAFKTLGMETQQMTDAKWHGVRYQVTDVKRAADFYTSRLGFTLVQQHLPAFATIALGDYKIFLSGEGASGSRAMPNGTAQTPGGWNR